MNQSAAPKSMETNEDILRSHELAQRAIGLLNEHGLAASPANFAIWHTYVSGTNKGVARAIEDRLSAGELKQEDLDALHDEFFSTKSTEQAMMELGDAVTQELDSVQVLLKTASQDTSSYGNALEGVSSQLTKTNDSNLIKMVIDNLVSATKQMASRSTQLEERLRVSTDEVSRLKENLNTVRTQAMTDQLTTLPNRRAFDLSLERAIAMATGQSEPLSLVIGDIDHFKNFNDTWGHQTGDQVLRLVAHCMRESVRRNDVAARYGGEEFAVIMPEISAADAKEIAERIRETVQSKKVMKRSTGQDLGTITMSLGVATLHPEEAAADFIKRADACLYAAKRAGRNQVLTEDEIDTATVLEDAAANRDAKAAAAG